MRVYGGCMPAFERLCVDVVGDVLCTLVVVEHVVGYSEQPRGESRHALKTGDVGVGLDERVLGQIVAQLRISQRLVQEEPAHR